VTVTTFDVAAAALAAERNVNNRYQLMIGHVSAAVVTGTQ